MTIDPDEDFDLLPEDGLIQFITEYWGRRQTWLPPQFAENELIVGPYPLNVNLLGAGYVPAFPNLEAIVVATDGTRSASKGGYIKLPPGQYMIYYVDRQERYSVLPAVSANTLDGATVGLTCGITFTVKNAKSIQNIRNPLEALFRACEAALRHVIRTHSHDQFFGEPDNPDVLPNQSIADAVQHQVTANQACRAFTLHNVNIIERQGDAQLLNLRETKIARLHADENEIQNARMRARILEERHEVEVKQGAIIAQEASNESHRRQILLPTDKRLIELERQRQLPRLTHEEILKELDTRGEALKSLIQAEAMPGFPRNAEDLQKMVSQIIKEMPNISMNQAPPPDDESEADDLNMTLVQLLIPKKKE